MRTCRQSFIVTNVPIFLLSLSTSLFSCCLWQNTSDRLRMDHRWDMKTHWSHWCPCGRAMYGDVDTPFYECVLTIFPNEITLLTRLSILADSSNNMKVVSKPRTSSKGRSCLQTRSPSRWSVPQCVMKRLSRRLSRKTSVGVYQRKIKIITLSGVWHHNSMMIQCISSRNFSLVSHWLRGSQFQTQY
jgi:hypothetical protein